MVNFEHKKKYIVFCLTCKEQNYPNFEFLFNIDLNHQPSLDIRGYIYGVQRTMNTEKYSLHNIFRQIAFIEICKFSSVTFLPSLHTYVHTSVYVYITKSMEVTSRH